MLKEVLCLTRPCYLSTKEEQFVVRYRENDETITRPIEDIGFVVLEHPRIILTQGVLGKFATLRVLVIVCDPAHYPAGWMLPMVGHHKQVAHMRAQVNASLPLKKQLWQQTIQAKIRNQAALLKKLGKPATEFPAPKQVEPGDATGIEGYAARLYWQALFPSPFLRGRFGSMPNPWLNYGYAVLRAATSRSLVVAGLLPMLGIHHRNAYASFCLADDIMEPYRPIVDELVYGLWSTSPESTTCTPADKKELLQCLFKKVNINKATSPLMVALQHTCQSLAQCFSKEARKLLYPSFPRL